jgi:hypothetical protein
MVGAFTLNLDEVTMVGSYTRQPSRARVLLVTVVKSGRQEAKQGPKKKSLSKRQCVRK